MAFDTVLAVAKFILSRSAKNRLNKTQCKKKSPKLTPKNHHYASKQGPLEEKENKEMALVQISFSPNTTGQILHSKMKKGFL